MGCGFAKNCQQVCEESCNQHVIVPVFYDINACNGGSCGNYCGGFGCGAYGGF